jgi:hypothetical protein
VADGSIEVIIALARDGTTDGKLAARRVLNCLTVDDDIKARIYNAIGRAENVKCTSGHSMLTLPARMKPFGYSVSDATCCDVCKITSIHDSETNNYHCDTCRYKS